MDRRKSLKLIATSALAGGVLAAGCKPGEEKKEAAKTTEPEFALDRYAEEIKHERSLLAQEKFFSEHEMATIAILADIIIPKDDVSGSATDAKVPEFIEFIVKDMPEHQIPMKGGLRWLDLHCFKQYEKAFKDCDHTQQIAVVDAIAYPNKAKAEMKQGVAFFSLMRNLTVSGFYTSEIGVKDLGYAGNRPTQWNGVPDEVLKQYNIAYTEKELKECVKYS
ncbi:MAG: gluconate 2-dehydrogenase subunit 3 family protein [Chitinophagaceae bacterium]|nr:MAG: gluconate 2-dehydrogenase subunit 3 family protein [Chitinophagaceae bacterium]